MDKKTKTALIVGALLVGAYLLYRKSKTKGGTVLNKLVEELDEDGNVIEQAEKQAATS